jgi:hypothetical protein
MFTHAVNNDATKQAKSTPSIYRAASQPQIQRKENACGCGGGCPTCSAATSGLTINSPGGSFEQEADSVAAQVMRMEAPSTLTSVGATVQRACACGGSCPDCAADTEGTLQRKDEVGEGGLAPPSVHQTLSRSGQPLDSSTRGFMESRFGADFSGVRVHTDPSAARSAADVQARAYTVSHNVVFAAGEYAPGSANGMRLLAHELAHVVQQSGGAGGLSRSPRLLARAKAGKETACIRPVCIADDDGKNPTTPPSFDSVKRVWGNCCIDFSVKSGVVVKKTAYKTLDESPNSTPTAEETALFTAAGGGGGCVSVYVATEFAQGGTTGKDISGGGGTYDGGKADPKVVVVEGVDPTIVAHEVGHALGISPHGPAHTIMNVTASRHDQAEEEKVNKAQCDKARAAPTTSAAAAKADCDVPD